MEYKMIADTFLSITVTLISSTVQYINSLPTEKMKTILYLAVFNLIGVLAGPAPYGGTVPTYVSKTPERQFSKSNVGIVNQWNQVNDDGSYTFGYESGDGSFRIENRDADGFVTGKYGYIDANGKVQEYEYVAGSLGGRSLGYQTRGTNSINRGQPFPVVGSVSVGQKGIDLEYSSVDDNRDGIPDRLTTSGIRGNRNRGQNIRLTTQGQTGFDTTPTQVVRVVNPTPVVSVQPSVVRLTTQIQPETPSKIVRVVNPTPVQPQSTVVRLTSPPRTVVQPSRGSSFQMIKPNRQRQPQLVQSVVRNPFVNRFSNQQFVTTNPMVSGGRFNQVFGGFNTNSGRDSFGRLVVRGNRPSFIPSVQTIIVDDDDDDDFDFDDINDFDDDDDMFIINSSAFGFGR